MEIKINSKVKHAPSGDIVTVTKINQKTYTGKSTLHPYSTHVRVEKTDCELYVEPIKEKSNYDKMRERNMEDAKTLSSTPKEVGQHILWLKMAVIDRVEKIENLTNKDICTFRTGKIDDENSKFGFTEQYVNLLMHYAYEAGKKNATDSLTRSYNESTKNMKDTIESIVQALDLNGLLPDNDNPDW